MFSVKMFQYKFIGSVASSHTEWMNKSDFYFLTLWNYLFTQAWVKVCVQAQTFLAVLLLQNHEKRLLVLG